MQDLPSQSLSHRVTIGSIWVIASRALARGIDFCALIIFARIFRPEDFGLIAIAMSIILIVESILDVPIAQALLSLKKITKSHLDTAFTVSLIRGVLLSAFVIIISFPAALIYHDGRIIPLLCALSLAPFARGMQNPNMIWFLKSVDFKRDLAIEVISKILSFLIAISFAIYTKSYWSIVINTIMMPIFSVIISYWFAPFLPKISLFHWPDFKSFFGWNSASQILGAFSWQSDRLILGALLPQQIVGQYALASDISALPEQSLIKPIVRPLLSAFSAMRDEPDRLRKAYLNASEMITLFGAPIMIGLALLAGPFTHLALGEKWQGAVPIIQWLALSLIPPLIYSPLFPLAMALGKPRTFFVRSYYEIIVKVSAILIGIYNFGLMGVIVARLFTAIIMMIMSMKLVRNLIYLSIVEQIRLLSRIVIANLVLALSLLIMRPYIYTHDPLSGAIGIALVAIISAIFYGVTLVVAWLLWGRPNGAEAKLLNILRQAFRSIIR